LLTPAEAAFCDHAIEALTHAQIFMRHSVAPFDKKIDDLKKEILTWKEKWTKP
jgi:hypothetical protein